MSGVVRVYESDSIEDHMGLIQERVEKSLKDRETVRLAKKIAAQTPDGFKVLDGMEVPIVRAWGLDLLLPLSGGSDCGDGSCTVNDIWNFVVANVRYELDPDGYDLFCTTERTLDAGAGDCVPGWSLLLREDGALVPIAEIQEGERIWDGQQWVRVTKWWDKGILPVRRFDLNNGCSIATTDEHRMFRVPRVTRLTKAGVQVKGARAVAGASGTEEECLAQDLDVGDDLLQPVGELVFGGESLDPDMAYLLGLWVAEGWKDNPYTAFAGIADYKGHRERALEILERRGWHSIESDTTVRTSEPQLRELVAYCGKGAYNKRLPHTNYDRATTEAIINGLNADGGFSNSGTFVFSTVSPTLAIQYRLMQRRLGHSCSIKEVHNHGGFGDKPVYRVTVRKLATNRVWARIRTIAEAGEAHCYDIETESGRIYFPESDVITHNCDDMVIVFGALLTAVGFDHVYARVVSTDGDRWQHVYAMVGLPKRGRAKEMVALDPTVTNAVPGWEYTKATHRRDFKLG